MTDYTVVDSGLAVKWCVAEPDSAQANLIYDAYQYGMIELLAPDLIYAEFGNVIWKKRLFQNLSEENGNAALAVFQKINFKITTTADLFDDAFQIAVKHKRTFYDSLYLALSVRENCEFVTADEKFYNSVKADFPNIVLLANWK
jgi:predicted nucleic acid-binding protein